MANYSEKLKDPRWQKKRLEILNRDEFKCTLCGDDKTTLQVHHKKYNGEPWEVDSEDLITVCEDCHFFIEMYKTSPVKILKFNTENFVSIQAFDSDRNIIIHQKDKRTKENYAVLLHDLMFDRMVSFYNEFIKDQNKIKDGKES
ncbi:MAG: hypothetical protein NVSMB45_15070 [Ginsengibacter sp.]